MLVARQGRVTLGGCFIGLGTQLGSESSVFGQSGLRGRSDLRNCPWVPNLLGIGEPLSGRFVLLLFL